MAAVLTRPQKPNRNWLGFPSLASMSRDFDDLFGGLLDRDKFVQEFGMITPSIDLAETEQFVEVTTDLPGVKAEQVHVSLQDNCLVISGEYSEETDKSDKDKKFHHVERRQGKFSRSVWLPCPVNESQVSAELKDGVLRVKLPKTTESKAKRIPVSG